MTLSCSCDFEPDDFYDWFYWVPDNYSVLETLRRKRCTSCGELIDIGSTVAEFSRSRFARDEIEERINGGDCEAVWLAPLYLCECCADLYFSLYELGFECVSPDENMRELVKEYHDTYGPKESTA